MKSTLKIVSLCLAMAMMTACQTAQTAQTPTPMVASQQHSAKQTLKSAIKKTAKTAFSYQSTIIVDNSLRLSALNRATPKQLSNASHALFRCAEQHENAYVALGKQAMAQGLDISSDSFVEQKQKLKDDFLACQKTYGNRYGGLLSEFDGEETDEQSDKAIAGEVLSGNLKKNNDNYDDTHTAQDVKKAKLLQEYLLNASQVSIVGNYRPLIGTLTALPMADYEFYNAKFMINQPIYVDFKAGDIYLWADNLALANATYLDKHLGLAWQHKWLKLPINDGSLPKEFKDDFIKNYLAALENSYDSLDESAISYEKPPQKILDKLNNNQRQIIAKSSQIIAKKDKGKGGYNPAFLQNFYNAMTQKYPALTEPPSKQKMDSLRLMQSLFKFLDKKAKISDNLTTDNAPNDHTTLFGLNTKGEIDWVLSSRFVPTKFNPENEPFAVHSFTVLDSKIRPDFERLSQAFAKPTDQTSIDLLAYSNELKDSLAKSENLYVQLLARSIFGSDDNDNGKDDELDLDKEYLYDEAGRLSQEY